MSAAYLDPGSAKDCAFAVYEDLQLTALGWIGPARSEVVSGVISSTITDLLWEKPQVYPKSKGNPNQLIDLAIAGAVAAARFGCATRTVKPRDWKGTIGKPQHHSRLWPILAPAEQALFPEGTGEYIRKAARGLGGYSASVVDLLDAAALGCYDLGRLPGPLAGKVQALKAARSSNPQRKHRYGKR
jgi:hypothetical protein